MTALTSGQAGKLASCEAVIERGLTSFVEVGRALTDIRDGKLYRANFKTFEAYCKERWEIGRSRAYELIDQAKVTVLLADAGLNLSAAADISKRDARALKDNPAAVAKVKERVAAGEPVGAAVKTIAAEKKAQREAEQAENDRHRDAVRATLPPQVQRGEAAKARNGSTQAAIASVDAIEAERDELREENTALKADLAERDRRLALFDEMAAQFEKGGIETILTTKDDRIRALQRQVEDMSADRASLAKSRDYWKKQAMSLGYVSPNSQIEAGTPATDPADEFATF